VFSLLRKELNASYRPEQTAATTGVQSATLRQLAR